jgi:hypothetical protein
MEYCDHIYLSLNLGFGYNDRRVHYSNIHKIKIKEEGTFSKGES